MTACVQKVYEKASKAPAATPALRDLLTEAVRNVRMADRRSRPKCREEIQRARRILRAGQQHEGARQGVVERIRLASTHFRPEDRGLEPARVTQIDSRKQRLRVCPERERGNDRRDRDALSHAFAFVPQTRGPRRCLAC